jgi:hypothetical protein
MVIHDDCLKMKGSQIVIEIFQFKKTEQNTYAKDVKFSVIHNPQDVL